MVWSRRIWALVRASVMVIPLTVAKTTFRTTRLVKHAAAISLKRNALIIPITIRPLKKIVAMQAKIMVGMALCLDNSAEVLLMRMFSTKENA